MPTSAMTTTAIEKYTSKFDDDDALLFAPVVLISSAFIVVIATDRYEVADLSSATSFRMLRCTTQVMMIYFSVTHAPTYA